MFFSTASVAILSIVGLASAQPTMMTRDEATAFVRIETNLGGVFGDVKQKTVQVPIGAVYTNEQDLAAVSTLYLMGATGVEATAVTCSPFKETSGSGSAGKDFTSGNPSYLSTNTVTVGSIVCKTA